MITNTKHTQLTTQYTIESLIQWLKGESRLHQIWTVRNTGN